MLNAERLHAEEALKTGVYCTWRSSASSLCARVGSTSRCFCGLQYDQHRNLPNCKMFEFVPSRPEEVGDDFLPRRRGFNVSTWRAKCKCGHTHEDHANVQKRCTQCRCSVFASNFLCTVCDKHFEDHETVWESEKERALDGRAVGDAFIPLSEIPQLQNAVFGGGGGGGGGGGRTSMAPQPGNWFGAPQSGAPVARRGAPETPEELMSAGKITVQEYMRLISEGGSSRGDEPEPMAQHHRVGMKVLLVSSAKAPASLAPPQDLTKVDRSIALSHVSSGGLRTGKVLNRYGKAEER